MDLKTISEAVNLYDTPLYLFDEKELITNYIELENAYRNIYPNFQIAYSFKTNYTPAICRRIHMLEGYAEVVSEFEYKIARICGFQPENIIVNGPGKWTGLETMLEDGAVVMLDNAFEFDKALRFAEVSDCLMKIGFRVNFELKQGKTSRFGFDTSNTELLSCIERARKCRNIEIVGLHFHQSGARSLQDWEKRIDTMIALSKRLLNDSEIKIIDLGSGMFGHMDQTLAEQFDQEIPSFQQYAEIVAKKMKECFGMTSEEDRPLLVVEPGTTIVANTMTYVTRVISTKTIKKSNFAIVDGSVQQLGEIGKKKKLPLKIMSVTSPSVKPKTYTVSGYTCLEDDILYRDLEFDLNTGDVLCFGNAGAYTNVLKPPFIQVGCKIVMKTETGRFQLIKRMETVEDILASYL